MVLSVYGFPSGVRPTLAILSFASSTSWMKYSYQRKLFVAVGNRCIHTRAVKTQLGLAVPGVSGRKKKARTATGREMTPLITAQMLDDVGKRGDLCLLKSHLQPARPRCPSSEL